MAHIYERTIRADGRAEIEIKKSRFVCSLFRVTDEAGARSTVERTRKEFWDANHNCTAWRIGTQGRSQRSSDDGEPSGTAGVPMLEVLNHRDLTDVLAIVTRYFGGTKLGAGGLIRAYGSAVSTAIEAVGIVERRPLHVISARISHADSGRVENTLRSSIFPLAEVSYNPTDVAFWLHLEPKRLDPFGAFFAEVTSGTGLVEDVGVLFVEVPVESAAT